MYFGVSPGNLPPRSKNLDMFKVTTNQWVDQSAVCSALKLDTFTVVTITFEWLDRFSKTKISIKSV